MPKPKYILNVDGKEQPVSVDNIKRYGIDRYAQDYPDATIRMRDENNDDYDIPISQYQRGLNSGLRPFRMDVYAPGEKNQPQEAQQQWLSMGLNADGTKPVPEQSISQEYSIQPTQQTVDSQFSDQTELITQQPQPKSKQSQFWEQFSMNRNSLAFHPQDQDEIAENLVEKQETSIPSLETQQSYDKLYKDKAEPLFNRIISEAQQRGIKAAEEYAGKFNTKQKGLFSNFAGMGFSLTESNRLRNAETDPAKIIQQFADELQELSRQKDFLQMISEEARKEGVSTEQYYQGFINDALNKVQQYYIKKNIPKNTLEYILRSGVGNSILGMFGDISSKPLAQRQIETAGLQAYQPSSGEKIAAMATGIVSDLPIMAVTGGIGETAGNALIRPVVNRIAQSGISRVAAEGIARRAVQQTGMRWGVRAASEAVNFAVLEGIGSAVGQAHQTNDVKAKDVLEAFGKGAVTGAAMGIFGTANQGLTAAAKRRLGKNTGQTLGYTSSLGGRTAILTGSSVIGQYMNDPDFNIRDIDWTEEIVHAGLMNIGFDILGVAKRYSVKRPDMKDIDFDKLKLTKEEISRLNQTGIAGTNAREIAESLLHLDEATKLRVSPTQEAGIAGREWTEITQELGLNKQSAAIARLLMDPNIDLATKAKIGYLMTGVYYRLSPSTNLSIEQNESGNFVVNKFTASGQTNESHTFSNRSQAEDYARKVRNEIKPNQVRALEEMMDNAGKVATAIRLFDMIADQYGLTRSQITELYARGRQGESLGRYQQAYDTLNSTLKSITSVEDYQYSPSELRRRMNEGYGKEDGWMESVLRKEYNRLNEQEKQAYEEYITNMQRILQGESKTGDFASLSEKQPFSPEAKYDFLSSLPAKQTEIPESPISAAQSSRRNAERAEGAAIYAVYNPQEMRSVEVQRRIALRRLQTVMSNEQIEALTEMDELQQEEVLSGMDNNTRRLASDFLQKNNILDGLNEAIDAAHAEEYDAAKEKLLSMTSPNGHIVFVPLGRFADATHEYGIVVNGINEQGKPTMENGQMIVVPLESQNWKPIYNSFNIDNAISIIPGTNESFTMRLPKEILPFLLASYQEDINIVEGTPIVVGDRFLIADTEGNTEEVNVIGIAPTGDWIVLEEGQSEPITISDEDLSHMRDNAEELPFLQSYAEQDAAFKIQQETEQKAAQKEKERIAAQQKKEEERTLAEAEKVRIVEEMKKPINRLNKYPEGHQKAGLPDYESSNPEDVRDYLIENLGIDGAMKSVRSESSHLLTNINEKQAKYDKALLESQENNFGPDEAIAARQYLRSIQDEIVTLQKSLSFWQNMEKIIGGPKPEVIQQKITRSQASQKNKRHTYKPSRDYEQARKNMADSEYAMMILSDLSPHTLQELAADLLSNGVRLMFDSETVGGARLLGFSTATHYSREDVKRFPFIFASRSKGGLSVEEFGELLEQAALDAGIRFEGKSTQEGVNALIDLLQGVERQGDINRYIENNRIAESRNIYRQEQQQLEEERDRAYLSDTGLTYEEFIDMDKSLFQEYAETYKNFIESEEFTEFINNFASTNTPLNNEPTRNIPRTEEGNQPVGTLKSRTPDTSNVSATNAEPVPSASERSVPIRPSAPTSRTESPNQPRQASDAENDIQRSASLSIPSGAREDYAGTDGEVITPAYTINKRHHAKQDRDIFAVNFTERFDRDKFLSLKKTVKDFGGYYSSFGKGGFIFDTLLEAQRFAEEIAPSVYKEKLAEIKENSKEEIEPSVKSIESQIEEARKEVDANPTDAQKEAGNYKKGHIKLDGYDITIENPKGSERSGTDNDGNKWSITMNNDYGYIRGTESIDGDHIDIFLSDNPAEGDVYVVDQINKDGSFDEHKVMYGFNSALAAKRAYKSNYSPGWQGLGKITKVTKEDFKKWVDSSHRKTKPFAEYSSIKKNTEEDKAVSLQQNDLFNQNLEDNGQPRKEPSRRTQPGTTGDQKTDKGLGDQAREEDSPAGLQRETGSLSGSDVSDTQGSRGVHGLSSNEQPSVKRNQNNFSFSDNHLELPSGEIGKLKGNIDAIRTLKELEESGKPATPAQKQKLIQFVGWGGLADALNSNEYEHWNRVFSHGKYGQTAWSQKYASHYDELRPLLTDEEFSSAQASTLSSHYTPENVIRHLWSALEYMGFRGGKILEPAMGVGHILGFMPEEISRRSQLFGFELDSIPGRIAKQLYPDAIIQVAGYETAFKPNSKDAVITNVPFGQIAPVDPALDKTLRRKLGNAYNLHNYFIIKSLLELRPGGVGAFITSASTMDGRNSKAREYIASLGVDLLGAIRLPNNTFKANAGTEVTADMLFFRKRLPGERSNGVNFVTLSQVGTGTYKVPAKTKGEYDTLEVPLLVNEYFATRPEMMLGTVMTAHDAGSGGLYGGDSQTLVAKPGTNLSAELADAVTRLPEDALSISPEDSTDLSSADTSKQETSLSDGTLSVSDGKVYVASDGELISIAQGTFKYKGKNRSYYDAAKAYLELKDTLKQLIQTEQTQTKDPTALRTKLNEQYDDFVSKYGNLNYNKPLDLFLEEDFERFLPQSLEHIEIKINPDTGRKTRIVTKGTGILSHRVSSPMIEPQKADNLQDAIDISQAYHGLLDVDYISRMLNISPEEAREDILRQRQAFEDPVTGVLVDKDSYLSGNIREKLEQARNAAAEDSRFEVNVSELEAVMPEPIPFVDISYKIGTPWIPEDVYRNFASDVLGISGISIRYVPSADEFILTGGTVEDFTKANDFNTPARSTVDLFGDAINLRKPVIYRSIDKDHRVKDEAATQEAVQRIMDMNDAFIRHIQENSDLHDRLQQIYNERYNNYRLREYRAPAFAEKDKEGNVLYPGANKDITLRKHQVKAIQRSLQGSTLLAHQVGTGKTFTMITTAMEMRRLGLAKKPMIVVQNATLQDFTSDFLKLYPSARILAPSAEERSASQRKRLFNLIATGDFDAIIIPQSFLAFIPDDPGRKKALIQSRIDEIMNAADELDNSDKQVAQRLRREAKNMQLALSREEEDGLPDSAKRSNVKKQAKKEESAAVREARKLERRTDEVLTFEQMGVDALFIDEAHNFKKIGFSTKMQNVKGIDTGFSERANSLLLKSSFIQERNGGRNVILATGTPITNTMAEVWTMMRFVSPDILEEYNIRTFDEFAATFGQVEPSLEFTATGSFKIVDRFKSYVNVPELVKAFRSHADVVLTSDVPEFKENNSIPKLKNNQLTNHVIQKSEQLQDVMDVLIEALKEDEKKTGKGKTPGLPLVVFQKAKQSAIDLRLINPAYADDPDSKTNKVVSEILRIYKESTPDKGVQMVFSDIFQSPATQPAIDLFGYDPNVPRFNLYKDIKDKLVKAGIPKDQIVIVNEITNADRKKTVFQKARDGEVRVLIGGTEKMGVGVNVQDRMVALHHIDVPALPMDFEQRNGRILRQGNMYAVKNKPVEILTYGVQGTLDATAYDRLRFKQNFINQMMKGDVSGRVMEEQDDDNPAGKTFNQMAAELSGDQTAQMLFVAESNAKKLEGLKRSHEIKQQYARMEVAPLKTSIALSRSKAEKAEEASRYIAAQMPEGIKSITIGRHTYEDKLAKNLAEEVSKFEERYSVNRSLPPLTVSLNKDAARIIFHHDNGQLLYSFYAGDHAIAENKPVNTFSGIWLSVNSSLSNISKQAEDYKADILRKQNRLKGLESIIGKPFDKTEELRQARNRVSKLRAELEAKAKAQMDSTPKFVKSAYRENSIVERTPERVQADYERVSSISRNFEERYPGSLPNALVIKSPDTLRRQLQAIHVAEDELAVIEDHVSEGGAACYLQTQGRIVIFNTEAPDAEINSYLWHENTHYALSSIPKEVKEKLISRAYNYLYPTHVDQFNAIRQRYELDPEAVKREECIVFFLQHFFNKFGTENLERIIEEATPVLKDIYQPVYNKIVYGREIHYGSEPGRIRRIHQAESSGMVHNTESAILGRESGAGSGGTARDSSGTDSRGIKFQLSGKPRRKEGESLIAYNKRLKEWQQKVEESKRTRSIEDEDMSGGIDTELNDLSIEMMDHPSPVQKPGESEQAYQERRSQWEDWYNTRGVEIRNRLEKIHQEAAKRKTAERDAEMGEAERLKTTPPEEPREGEEIISTDLTPEEMREVRQAFHEKMGDAKILLTKRQAKRDIRNEIIERRRYIETSNLEDAFFVNDLKNAASGGKLKVSEVLKAIPEYIEGTYTGEVTPELQITAKMVSDWFEETYNLMAQEGVLYDAPQIQNYVTHIWDWKRTPKEVQERYANFVNTMRLRSPFTRHRVIPTYAEGIKMGMIPKYDDITGIVTEYGHYATETIANHRLIEFLRNFKIAMPGTRDNMPAYMDIIVPDTVKDPVYSRMNHTALDGYKVLNIIKPIITPVFGDQRIIDPSHLNLFTNKLIDGIWVTSSLMKKVALSFSFFHHGALTETAIAMLKPWGAAKIIGKELIWDTITKGEIPAMHDKAATRDAVNHLVSLGATNDYAAADIQNFTTQIYRFTKDKNVQVAKQAAFLLDFLNKGFDKVLWDTIHDGFKIASFAKMAKEVRAKAEVGGWTDKQLNEALDECGHLVNDTYGGLHFDILGFSPKSVRIMRALLLSPDWTLATTRQALSPFGIGQLYGNDTFWKNIHSKEPSAKMRKKYGREFWLTAGIFFYALMNALNAYFRVQDEEEQRLQAEAMREVDPEYKSPYELAYPSGMKWYDYLMPGNTISHQTHLFTGRYSDGTETYVRWGKQFRELPELFWGRDGLSFPGPMIDKLSGKANPLLSTTFEFISGYSLSGWENSDMRNKKGWEKDVARLYMLAKKLIPYSVPTQEDKDFMYIDLVMPSSKGFSPSKAISYFEKAIKSGDFNYVAQVYNACVKNNLMPEKYFRVAQARIEAEAKQNTIEGIETLQDATQAFNSSTDIKERFRLRRYIEQQLGAQDYHSISQEELVQQARDLIDGTAINPTDNERYLRLSTSQDITEDYRMKKNAAGLKVYYQDYTALQETNPVAAARMLREKAKFIEGYHLTTRYRSALNRLKSTLGQGKDSEIMKKIRALRQEYFQEMDNLERNFH